MTADSGEGPRTTGYCKRGNGEDIQMGKVNSKSKVFRWIRFILYTGCFTEMILYLSRYDNEVYDTLKARQGAWAFLFFGVILLVMQKVRWINWQSLVTTLAYAPFAVLECSFYVGSPDLFANHIVEAVTRWMVLMVIADMVATGRVRKVEKFHPFTFMFFGLIIVLLALFSKGQGVERYCYLLLACLIPLDKPDWDEIVDGLLAGGFLAFAYTTFDSFMTNPYFGVPREQFMEKNPKQGGRWYGNFLNIGAFGQFLGMSTALAVCSLYRSAQKLGRLSVAYFVSWIWLGGSVFLSVLNGTRNYMVGIAALAMVLFIFGFRKARKVGMIVRGAIVFVLVVAAGVAIVRFGFYVLSPEFNYDNLVNDLMKTPLKYVPDLTKYIANKFRLAHEGWDSGYGEGNVFAPGTIWSYLNLITSMRLGICYDFLRQGSFYGTMGGGIQYGDYFAYNAHNQYVQSLYVYGFLGGAVYILFVLSTWIQSIVKAVKSRHEHFYLPMIYLTVMVAMWLGEMSTLTYPLTFLGMFLMIPILVNCFAGEEKTLKEIRKEKRAAKKALKAGAQEGSGESWKAVLADAEEKNVKKAEKEAEKEAKKAEKEAEKEAKKAEKEEKKTEAGREEKKAEEEAVQDEAKAPGETVENAETAENAESEKTGNSDTKDEDDYDGAVGEDDDYNEEDSPEDDDFDDVEDSDDDDSDEDFDDEDSDEEDDDDYDDEEVEDEPIEDEPIEDEPIEVSDN